MNNLTRKQLLSWKEQHMKKTHGSDRPILIASGCSFTDSTACTTIPVSWPGYLKDRCGFSYVINVASSGNGNDYISTSIVNQIEAMSKKDLDNCMVLIIWTGIDRQEALTYEKYNTDSQGCIDGVHFVRTNKFSTNPVDINVARGEALRSWKNIIMMQNYLENKDIPFGFGFYINVFDPPFLPRRDLTKEFPKLLDPIKIDQLRKCSWFHDPNDSMFEWLFYQKENLFLSDGFHPSPDGYLKWTDNVLLPGLTKMGLIQAVDQ